MKTPQHWHVTLLVSAHQTDLVCMEKPLNKHRTQAVPGLVIDNFPTTVAGLAALVTSYCDCTVAASRFK